MGNFAGHAVPGSLFIIFGLWWACNVFRCYFKAVSKRKGTKNGEINPHDVHFNVTHVHNKALEGIIIVVAAPIAIVGEYMTAFEKGPSMCMDNLQHITMYSFFFLVGICYLLTFKGFPIPFETEFFAMFLAFLIETILFYFHLHGRSHLNVHIHTLLVIAALFCTISSLIEWVLKGHVLAALGRPFWTIVQGTWFFQAGFILYNPIPGARTWNEHNHHDMMLITSCFCWHVAGVFICFIFLSNAYANKFRSKKVAFSSTPSNMQYADTYNHVGYKKVIAETPSPPPSP